MKIISTFVQNHTESVLKEVLAFDAASDGVLARYFRKNKKLGQSERLLISEAIYAILRHRLFFSNCAESGVGAMNRRLALLGLSEIKGYANLENLSKDEKEWLERLSKIDRSQLSLKVKADLPQWLLDKLVSQYGQEETLQIAQALNESASLDLRVNTLKAKRDDVLEKFNAQSVASSKTPYSPLGIRLKEKVALQNNPLFKEGLIEVQDEGSQILAQILGAKRGEMVVDFCAGAGGKTLLLGAMMRNTGRLYAFDVSDKRLENMKARLSRSGLSNIHPIHIAHEKDARIKRLAGKADRVLVDAPCSGLGTLRRNPDLKWRQNLKELSTFVERQQAILESAAKLVKKGGRIVYATCSLLKEENEDQIERFLINHPKFSLYLMQKALKDQNIELEMEHYLKLLPHKHQTDGFFAAILEKIT